MKTPLLPTQLDDVANICAKEDLPNWSEPGTGKTLTTIGAIDKLRLQSGLVVCPTVATHMWCDLLASELGARVQYLKTRSTAIDKTADFLVGSYGVIGSLMPELSGRDNDALVVDESHYVKTPTASRTMCLFGENGDGVGGIYESSKQCWLLSGTPMERYADDLWSQLRATQPEILDQYGALTLREYQQQFCRMEHKLYGQQTKYVSVGNQQTRLLNRMLYTDIGIIRRTMKEVDPYMPPATHRNIFTPAKVDKELAALVGNRSIERLMDDITSGTEEGARMRHLMGLAKIKAIIDYIKSEAKTHPLIVGFWHEDVGKEIYKQLSGDGYAAGLIWGATSADARERIKRKMMAGDLDVIVGNIAAMGVAMDGLQSVCSHVIFAELEWSATKLEQFYKRVARKGQTQHVQVDYCTSLEPIDVALQRVANRKAEGALEIIG